MQVLNLQDYPGGRMPPGAKRVDRLTPFGNPYHISATMTRAEAIWAFEHVYLPSRPDLVARAKRELRGFHLCCWCAPLQCHAEVWLRVANDVNVMSHVTSDSLPQG